MTGCVIRVLLPQCIDVYMHACMYLLIDGRAGVWG